MNIQDDKILELSNLISKRDVLLETFKRYGKASDIHPESYTETLNIETGEKLNWGQSFIKALEDFYNEKDCFMCELEVPEEGIVIRKDKLTGLESYKLKSFRFLEKETKQLDKGESDIESENYKNENNNK